MAIPRRISFLEEWQIYIPRGSRDMKSIPRGPRGISRNELSQKSWKSHQKFKKKIWKKKSKKISIEFTFQSSEFSVIIPKIDRFSWKTEIKQKNLDKLLKIFWYFNLLSAHSVFSRSSANFGEESRSRGVIKSIPRGIEEWKKVRDLEDRGTRNSSCHP